MLVVFAGALIQGMIGFGMAVVAAPILYIIAPSLVPGTLICMAMFLALLTVRKYRGSIELADMKYAVFGRVPGSLLGAYLLAVASREQMSLFMGGAVLLAVFASLFSVKVRATKSSLFVAGVVSGVTGTTSSIGGPPVALVMQNETGDKIRASMSIYFVFSSIISLIFLAAAGMLGTHDVKYALMLVPPVLLGSKIASRISHRIDQKIIRHALLVLCSLAGISAIASAIR
ncbi:sulfite exporter TauE/SafE family protein [Endozoicomonas arenosclerae]|uniref:sulfite exporter TauE/SafE family protein n=1 Tax=Endozoicomonas arenosclerae TaxID=1633495 RepID=UPI00078392F9|nr:sulfite exporter TauE/SafE family protein [Endozoicomonas arenosclerae]